MIGDLVDLYKARHEPARAARLAGRFAGTQVLDRLTALLFLARLGLWAVVLLGGALAAAAILASIVWHGAFGFLAVLPGGLAWLAFRVLSGLRRGEDAVRAAAGQLTDGAVTRGIARFVRDDAIGADDTAYDTPPADTPPADLPSPPP